MSLSSQSERDVREYADRLLEVASNDGPANKRGYERTAAALGLGPAVGLGVSPQVAIQAGLSQSGLATGGGKGGSALAATQLAVSQAGGIALLAAKATGIAVVVGGGLAIGASAMQPSPSTASGATPAVSQRLSAEPQNPAGQAPSPHTVVVSEAKASPGAGGLGLSRSGRSVRRADGARGPAQRTVVPASRKERASDAVKRPSLEPELASLGHARELLRSGDVAGCRRELAHYAEAHPDGVLRTEADVLAIFAANAAGETERAQRNARRFLQGHPESPHRHRLQTLTGGDKSLSPLSDME